MKGFKYDKFKEEAAGGDSWGSYSDLFMVLSFVFLMMYVVSSLRSGTNSIQQQLEKQRVARENEDLKAQMKAYDTLKDQALNQEPEDEQEVYKELMNKLTLLQDEAKEKKEDLRRKARENEQNEMALNKYQQVVRNIINANLLAKNKLKVREEIIANKNETITDLNQEVENKKQEIVQNKREISKINQDLAKNIAELTKAQKNSKITKEKAYKQIALLKKRSQQKIDELNQETRQKEAQLNQISSQLAQTESANQELSTKLTETSEKLEKTVTDYETQIENPQSSHAAKMAAERKAFENKVKAANMTAQEKARQLAEFNRKAKEKNDAMNQQIANLQQDLESTQARENAKANENARLASDLAKTAQQLEKTVGDYEGQIKNLQDAHQKKIAAERAALEGKLQAANASAAEKARQLGEFNRAAAEKANALGKQISDLKGNLAEAQAKANARAKLSKEIGAALKAAGVDADVNPNTGDVVISFGKDYFDNGSSELKSTMPEVLNKFIPKYSESLFQDPKIASKITSVDIVGFASPTYQGKYIDPLSLNPEDQKAAKYNLDLSYKRARAIFDHMFDTNKINYPNQKQLLSLVKVTGRSFFSEGRAPSGAVPGMTQKEFCMKFDCKQAQKVIIKFNMDDKK